jgi:hypothetical protein
VGSTQDLVSILGRVPSVIGVPANEQGTFNADHVSPFIELSCVNMVLQNNRADIGRQKGAAMLYNSLRRAVPGKGGATGVSYLLQWRGPYAAPD